MKVLRGEPSLEFFFGRVRPWELCCRPGLKIDMSMMFICAGTKVNKRLCPRCKTNVEAPSNANFQW